MLNIYEQNFIKLLDSDLFEQNDFFISYVSLITIRQIHPSQKDYTEKHHIIPRNYFIQLKTDIDNSKNNIIKLSFREHALAHYYLFKCTKDLKLKTSNAYAIRLIANNKSHDNIETNIDKILNDEILEEIRLKQSLEQKNLWREQEYRDARIAWWTEDQRKLVGKRISEWHKKHPYKYSKQVICIETGKVFDSIVEAEKFYNIDHHVGLCCKNKNRTCGGYHWAYASDHETIKELSTFANATPQKYAAKEKIYCKELDKIFNSAVEAAKYVNGKSSHIHACCKGKLKSHKKLHWRYYNE